MHKSTLNQPCFADYFIVFHVCRGYLGCILTIEQHTNISAFKRRNIRFHPSVLKIGEKDRQIDKEKEREKTKNTI